MNKLEQILEDLKNGVVSDDPNNYLEWLVKKRNEEKALAAAVAVNISDLLARQKSFNNAVKSREDDLFFLMNTMNKQSLRLPSATLSISTRKSIPDWDKMNPETLSEEFVKVTKIIDRTAVNDFLKAGGEIEGLVMGEEKQSLSVRVK